MIKTCKIDGRILKINGAFKSVYELMEVLNAINSEANKIDTDLYYYKHTTIKITDKFILISKID